MLLGVCRNDVEADEQRRDALMLTRHGRDERATGLDQFGLKRDASPEEHRRSAIPPIRMAPGQCAVVRRDGSGEHCLLDERDIRFPGVEEMPPRLSV
jgi:hypothetical protein